MLVILVRKDVLRELVSILILFLIKPTGTEFASVSCEVPLPQLCGCIIDELQLVQF